MYIDRFPTTCIACGTTFFGRKAYPSTPASRYCSRACVAARQSFAAQQVRADRYFWPNVRITEKCWLWAGGRDPDGYGRLSGGKKQAAIRAHRFSWVLHRGPIPSGLWVLHHCDNPPCVRPDHLFLGKAVDNNRDMQAKGRAAQGARHGSRLHPERMLRGEQIWNARLRETDIPVIRSSSESSPALANRYGVTRSAINRARSGKTWRHI